MSRPSDASSTMSDGGPGGVGAGMYGLPHAAGGRRRISGGSSVISGGTDFGGSSEYDSGAYPAGVSENPPNLLVVVIRHAKLSRKNLPSFPLRCVHVGWGVLR